MLYVMYVRNTNKIHRIIFENESWGAGVLGTGVQGCNSKFFVWLHIFHLGMNGLAARTGVGTQPTSSKATSWWICTSQRSLVEGSEPGCPWYSSPGGVGAWR